MRGDLEWGTVPGLVRAAAGRYADVEAVVEGRTRITYAELGDRVERAAAACLANGVEPGDRVGVWAPNTLDWIVCSLGAVSAGAVLVPLNTRFKGAEAAYVLARSRTKLLFVTGTFLGTSYVAALRRACAEGPAGERPLPGLPHLEQVVVLSDDAPDVAPAGPRTREAGPSTREAGRTRGAWKAWATWKEFLASGDGTEPEQVRAGIAALDPAAPCDIVFTSGTTGRPKGAVITHAQTLRAYDVWCDLAGLREGDRYLVVNPFFHTFGYKAGVLACLMRGATIVPQPVFDVGTALANIAAERISVLPGPPTLHQSLLDHPHRDAYDLSALRLVVTGAAVVPLRLVERLRRELGVDTVLTAYGLSEASGIVSMCRRSDAPGVIAATSGRAIPGTEVKVVDPAGAALAPGTPGEVLVRGFNVMRGYYEDAPATAEALTPDGWLRTGDIGVLDEAGNLRITDRIKDMFVVGGFNAYPAEIEQLLGLHPDVADVAVVGVPDARLGEVGRAYVVRRPDAPLTGDDLIAWARREMANYKVPRTVEFVGALPRNASGKVLKGELRGRG
ncbi:FadD3 family acyl-CoA ligase [Streptomyces apricus]|uniref:FadD3 family acyl-CoA ligase n=1 Tax=Streptomyces apricus TaxID=1828112 RepID=UPI00165FF73B|nr:FadD3 family acyl-CoA ligase [Streptomyces apricus]